MSQPGETRERLFRLSYIHTLPNDGGEEGFHIGIYSSRENAEHARAKLAEQPGFRDDLEGFVIDKIVVDQTDWQEGFVTEVYGDDDEAPAP